MVNYALNGVYEGINDQEQKNKLLYTIVEITEGKIFVEVN